MRAGDAIAIVMMFAAFGSALWAENLAAAVVFAALVWDFEMDEKRKP